MAPDTGTYSGWADALIRYNFNPFTFLKNIEFSVPPYLYLSFIILVALTKILAGNFWPQLIVLLNVICWSGAGVMLAKTVYTITKNKFSVWAVTVLYAANIEILLWIRYVLSDTIYAFVNFSIFYVVTSIFYRKDKTIPIKSWVAVFLLLLINISFRPAGLVMIPIVACSFYFWIIKTEHKTLPWKFIYVSFSLLCIVVIFLHALVIKNIENYPLSLGSGYFKGFVANNYKEGVVVFSRPNTYHRPPSVILDYVAITADKFFHYFYFLNNSFSLTHKVINIFLFVPLYFLSILGILGLLNRKMRIELEGNEPLIGICVLTIVSYALFHSLTGLDFDWRFRLPIMPYLLVLSSLGILLLKNVNKRRPL